MCYSFPAAQTNLALQYQQEWQRCPVPGSKVYSARSTGLHGLQQTQQGVIDEMGAEVSDVDRVRTAGTTTEDLLTFAPEHAVALPHPAGFTGVMIMQAHITPEVEGPGAEAGTGTSTAAAHFPSMYC